MIDLATQKFGPSRVDEIEDNIWKHDPQRGLSRDPATGDVCQTNINRDDFTINGLNNLGLQVFGRFQFSIIQATHAYHTLRDFAPEDAAGINEIDSSISDLSWILGRLIAENEVIGYVISLINSDIDKCIIGTNRLIAFLDEAGIENDTIDQALNELALALVEISGCAITFDRSIFPWG